MTQYFEKQTGAFRPTDFSFTSRGRTFNVTAGSGVFSKHELDTATALLLSKVLLQGTERVLDLGCGWGPIGLVLKSTYPTIDLVMVDTNPRAVTLSKKNLERHKLQAKVVVSDSFSAIDEMVFDTILLNPPMAAGRAVCDALIAASEQHLCIGGRFYLVARYQKGGKMLEQKMDEVFGNCTTVVKGGGFRVFCSEKKA